jgi:diadenosine tetraphosphate (Ap4A) HIT family hydrolase
MERTAIHDLVDQARAGSNPYIITKLEGGWVMAADQPIISGHCVLLSDPVVFGINDLNENHRQIYSRDCCRVGDALLKIVGAYRINYETMCNVAQALHTQIIPRYMTEPDAKRRERPAIAYPQLKKVEATELSQFIAKMREELSRAT